MLDTVSEPKVENPVDYSPSDSEGKKSSTSSTSSNSKDPCRGIDDDPICNFEDAAVKQGIDNECKDAKGDKLKECCNVVRTRLNNFLKECKDNPKKIQLNVKKQNSIEILTIKTLRIILAVSMCY